MTRFVLRRLGWAVLTAWFVVTATFAMLAVIPADPARAILGPHATEETLERVRGRHCLDDGPLEAYGCWLVAVAKGDLGDSYRSGRRVVDILGDRVWPTVQLAIAALALQLAIGVPLGILAAARRRRWQDHATSIATLVAQSAPPFVVGTLLVYVLAYRFGWFPIAGYGTGGLDRLHHLVLPALTTAAFGTAYYARVVRAEMIDALDEDYVRTARAKGVGERGVLLRHALRPSLGPLLTLVGLDLAAMLGGAVIIEPLFAWPGLGREVALAIREVDVPVIVGAVLVAALAVTLVNLVVDLAYAWIDPRLRE